MASGKGIMLNAFARLLLREGVVSAVSPVGEHFRSITLIGPSLRSTTWLAGDKIQVLLPSLDVRTYTPRCWDAAEGSTELLVYHHGHSPGAEWSRTVAVGAVVRFVGPQRSLRAPGDDAVLFGDETSFAVAQALASVQPRLTTVFEVESRAESLPVLAKLGLADVTVVERREGDQHLAELAAKLTGGNVLLTGRAQSIQALRSRLRALAAPRPSANKAYWSVGKVGLD